jgi:hypothetical protein
MCCSIFGENNRKMVLSDQKIVIKNFLFLPLLVLAGLLFSCGETKNLPETGGSDSLIKGDVYYLASDKLEGRETGTKGETKAAAYISERFENIGVAPAGEDGTYYQTFTFNPKNPHASSDKKDKGEIEGRNVIAFIDHGADHTIIFGAHYDHLGFGGEGSLYRGKPAIHNGADDNASGVAGLLYLAEYYKENDKGSNYLFIAFSGEEKGLWGSSYFVKNPTIDLYDVNFMVNMDMIGRLDADRGLAVNGIGTSPVWRSVVDNANEEGIKIIYSESGVGASDHTSFYYADIPVLQFFTGQHDDYHRPDDDPDKINYEGIAQIMDIITGITAQLNDQEPLAFTKTVEGESQKAPRFSVTLGIVPDYLYDGLGLRLDGVSEGKPAQKAGLQKGDIVIKMGDLEIADIYDYMEGLANYKPGDTATVEVKRGEEVLRKEVTF